MSTNIANAKSGGSHIEAGTYPAVCSGVVDLGLQKTDFNGEQFEKLQVMLMWELPTERIEIDGEDKPRQMSKTFTFSTSDKSTLRKYLKNWRGRDFSAEELKDFDLKNVIGAPCMLTIVDTDKGSSRIDGVSKAVKGMDIPAATRKIHIDLDDRKTWVLLPELADWMKSKINDSVTFQERGLRVDIDGNVREVMPITAPPVTTGGRTTDSLFTVMEGGDEGLPF